MKRKKRKNNNYFFTGFLKFLRILSTRYLGEEREIRLKNENKILKKI